MSLIFNDIGGQGVLKTVNIIILLGALLIVAVVCFVGGIIYANKTITLPKDGKFEVDGYFTNIQESDLSIFDDEYPYFTKGTGASKKEAEDYKKHIENYVAYEAELVVENLSNHDIVSIWAVLPGYQANYESVTTRQGYSEDHKRVWLNCWLSEGAIGLPKGETLRKKLHFIVKKDKMSDREIKDLLMSQKVNLQLDISEKSISSLLDINRTLSYFYPVFFKER